MRANPGGTLDPDEVFGRDRLIARIWRTLETRSVVLGADRRYGKTSVINKMAHEPREGWTCVTDDLENVKSPLKFVDAVYQQTKDHLSGRQKRANRLGELLRKLTGTEFLGFKIPEQVASDWELVLNALLDDLEENVEGRFVFFWDEMPYMIQNIMDAQGEAVARHLLDVLRKRRDQVGSGLRMVFTGSIGLHHVLNSIREEGNTAAEPTNDMEKETVLPLAKEDAFELTKLLLLGEGVQAGGNNPIGFLVDRVDALPYYIHHVVDTLVNEQLSATPETIERVVRDAIEDPRDPWELAHYRKRLSVYYGSREPLARAILDTVARSDTALSRDTIVETVLATGVSQNRQAVLDLIGLLEVDHYLARDDDRALRFASKITRDWWRYHHGI